MQRKIYQLINDMLSMNIPKADINKYMSWLKNLESTEKVSRQEFKKVIIAMANTFKEINFVFRPHPSLNKGYWCESFAEVKNIDVISTMYDKVFEYLKKDSEYNKKCKEGWPISCKLNEFSGELFKNQRTESLATYITGENSLINNHCLYKFFFMENDMWDDYKSVFLNKHLWND